MPIKTGLEAAKEIRNLQLQNLIPKDAKLALCSADSSFMR
jgi:hypothetical protein